MEITFSELKFLSSACRSDKNRALTWQKIIENDGRNRLGLELIYIPPSFYIDKPLE